VYTDNSIVDPWLVSNIILQNTKKLCPLVAIQPVYMHPYSVAKMVASFGHLYGRRMYLNMVAGGFKNDLIALNDTTPHDERYTRLIEYTTIIKLLLSSPAPVTFEGKPLLKLTIPQDDLALPRRTFPRHLDVLVHPRQVWQPPRVPWSNSRQISETRVRTASLVLFTDGEKSVSVRSSPARKRGRLECRRSAIPVQPKGAARTLTGYACFRLRLAQVTLRDDQGSG
jgi:alkanesulfonate monooxygenase SsuD/methylene tetrahydromethanopterin reductase-like flavin-dependent oxidoreductase (luciferase family)